MPDPLETVDLGPLTADQRAELEDGEDDPFDEGAITLRYRRKDRHVALRERGRLVASTGLTTAEVEVGGERFPVVGIGGVIVNHRHRGRGLGRRIVAEALARAERIGPRFALLFCHADRVGLYERAGFAVIDDPVEVGQPDGFASSVQVVMWRALQPGATWPPGPVRVLGLPF